jgi:hypothetical protein
MTQSTEINKESIKAALSPQHYLIYADNIKGIQKNKKEGNKNPSFCG